MLGRRELPRGGLAEGGGSSCAVVVEMLVLGLSIEKAAVPREFPAVVVVTPYSRA